MPLLGAGVLALLLNLAISYSQILALTMEQVEILKNTGLSHQTITQLSELAADPDRTRTPSLTFEEAKKLSEEGISEYLIKLIIILDQISGRQPKMTISPASLIKLKKAGVSEMILGLMLESEIKLASYTGDPKRAHLARCHICLLLCQCPAAS